MAFPHSRAAAMLRDGGIVAAMQEERFTHKKRWPGFPANPIAYRLAEAKAGAGSLGSERTGATQ
ncbi:MAG: hypothetical protein ACREDD_04180 [Methylocella sp.]